MSKTRKDVLKSAIELSESDQLLCVTELMETVSHDLPGWALEDPGLIDELESRANDGSQRIPWESVRTQLLSSADRDRRGCTISAQRREFQLEDLGNGL